MHILITISATTALRRCHGVSVVRIKACIYNRVCQNISLQHLRFVRNDNNDIRLTTIFQDNVGKPVPEYLHSWILLELRMIEVVRTRRAKLQSNRHHHQTNAKVFTGRMSFPSPNRQRQSNEVKKYRIPWTCLPQAHRRVFHPCL